MRILTVDNKNKIFTQIRLKRIAGFVIDAVIVTILLSIVYRITGFANFPGVFTKMIGVQKTFSEAASQNATVEVMALFNAAFLQSLFIWFCYDVLTTFILRGSTIGKMIFGLKLTHIHNQKGKIAYVLLMVVRSFLKFITMFLFQGIPFVISVISIFANPKSLAAHDRVSRLVVVNKNED
jgi:hypothetical protein